MPDLYVNVFRINRTPKKDSLVQPESLKRDKTVPHYIFLMTDGHDTCNAPRDIVAAKDCSGGRRTW